MPRESYYLPDRGLVEQADQAFIEKAHVPRSRFTGRKQRVTTFDAGYIVPFHLEEVLPGDHVKFKTHAYVRMSTPAFPLYSEQRVDIHWFFVPNRLVWANWIRFMGQQDSPGDSIAYTVPQITSAAFGFAIGALGDHFGLPAIGQPTAAITVSSLPFRGYNLVYNQWYRDENLVTAAATSTSDANVTEGVSYGSLRRRAKTHDYFTSGLPWPQKFTAPAALGTSAPITGIGVQSPATNVAGTGLKVGVISPGQPGGLYTPAFETNQVLTATAVSAGNTPLNIFADLSEITVNTLRQSFMVQALLERDARGGTRYTEINLSHFGVPSPDSRLQRTEFIGATSVPLGTTPIAQTAPGATGTVGALGGASAAFGQGEVSYAAQEHGYIHGYISVKSEQLYQQGIPRHFSRLTRLDYPWPSLSQMGEQAVLRKEIYATGVPANDDAVFSYMPRFDEKRFMFSDATGLMRSTSAGNVDEWHTGIQYNPAPTLGQTFIEDTPPMIRVLLAGAAANGLQYVANIIIERDLTCALPTYGTPATFGRF